MPESFNLYKDIKSFIMETLSRNLLTRLTTAKSLKTHSWFKFYNWETLLSLNATTSIKPKLNINLAFTDKAKLLTSVLESAKENTEVNASKITSSNKVSDMYDLDAWFDNF